MNMHLFFGLLLWIIGTAIILIAIVFPIIFWLFVIPKIQKRVGKKLSYNPTFYVYPIFIYTAYVDVALGILIKYVSVKFFNNEKRFKLDNRRPLETVSYDIAQASRSEIFFSFLSVLNILFLFIAFVVLGILLEVVK